jgi:hypothetical protein
MTKIYWGDAFTYIDQIEGEPSFMSDAIEARQVNILTYLFKRYKKNVCYMVRNDKEAVVYNNFESNEPQELHYRKVTPEDKLEEITDKYIWLEIPSLRFATTKEWILKAFMVFKDRKIFGVISSADLLKFPFHAVELNPRRIAGFKEILLATNKRIHTNNKKEIVYNEKYLSSLGFKIEDVYNADIKKRIKINMESYKMALLFNQNPDKTEQKIDKSKKVHQNYVRTVPDGKMTHHTAQERSMITTKGNETKKKNELIKKLELSCTDNPEFKHLAPYFRSRDVDMMLQALGEIMSVDSQRYLRGVKHEQDTMAGSIDCNVTQLSQTIFKHAESLTSLIEPRNAPSPTYNILNYKVNVGMAVENLNNAGLSEQQRQDLAGEIDRIITEQKRARIGGNEMVTLEQTVSGEAS